MLVPAASGANSPAAGAPPGAIALSATVSSSNSREPGVKPAPLKLKTPPADNHGDGTGSTRAVTIRVTLFVRCVAASPARSRYTPGSGAAAGIAPTAAGRLTTTREAVLPGAGPFHAVTSRST